MALGLTDSTVNDAVNEAAAKYGVDPNMLRAFMTIESSGNPLATTGSYKGLFQLSNSEFNKYGGGNIFNPVDNANAAAAKLKAEGEQFQSRYGRPPTASDLYMIHQQGEAGAQAHWANPGGVAWQNIRQYYPSDAVAKSAIMGNLPDSVKAQFGNDPDKITSGDFTNWWSGRVARAGGSTGPSPTVPPASSGPETVPASGLPPLNPASLVMPNPPDSAKTTSPAPETSDPLSAIAGAFTAASNTSGDTPEGKANAAEDNAAFQKQMADMQAAMQSSQAAASNIQRPQAGVMGNYVQRQQILQRLAQLIGGAGQLGSDVGGNLGDANSGPLGTAGQVPGFGSYWGAIG